MKKIDVKIKKLHPDAVVPTYGTDGAAGFDFYALEDVVLQSGETKLIKTGLAMAIPEGYEIQVRPRSGTSLKSQFRIANSPGTIDSDYRGECCVIGSFYGKAGESYSINKGDRIAQGVLSEVPQANFQLVEDLNETDRGAGGFGSTGKK